MAKASHKERIKAELRIQFGTLRAFEVSEGLPHDSVRDVLRGRSSTRTETAIAKALNKPVHILFPHRHAVPQAGESSTKRDDTHLKANAHRLSAEAA